MSINKIHLWLLFGWLLATSCTLTSPKIEVVCNELGLGYYQLVWETTPTIKGKVKIYISESPTQFRRIYPDRECNIEENTTSFFLPDSFKRKYFLLVFNNNKEIVTSNRIIKFDGIPNFRDVGGYENAHGQSVRWGLFYRSGAIYSLSHNTQMRLANLRPYTFIDVRDHNPLDIPVSEFPNVELVHLPIKDVDSEEVERRIRKNEFKKGDALLYIQDTYRAFIDDNHASFAQIFEILSNHQNYPVIVQGEFGKDKVAVVTALLLYLLDVPHESIIDDYCLSNESLEYVFKANKEIFKLSTETQDAVITLHVSDKKNINDLFRYITKRYGSIDKFLEEELEVDKNKRNMIRSILLKESK